jgi:glutathione S-transferase
MITLFSYPELFGVADNNPYGLKIYAFLKFCHLPFQHEHILDPSGAPRGQLPYISDDDVTVGDSDAIVAFLIEKYHVTIDSTLSFVQGDIAHMLGRTLDDLYWVMSYSRWSDPEFWPLFRQAFLSAHSEASAEALKGARKYNLQRYHYQGIGRFEPRDAYKRGLADLEILARLIGDRDFVFGAGPTSTDAAAYGFLANIYFFEIDTPLKTFVRSHTNLARYCERLHEAVTVT